MSKEHGSPRKDPPEKKFEGIAAKITKLLKKESDRGMILVLAAYLEELLGLIVRGTCVSDDEGASLLEFRAPAGTFDFKIQLCCAFGLVHPAEAAALNTLRKLRNAAAHFDKDRGFDVLFDSDSTIDLVRNLSRSLNLDFESRKPAIVRDHFIASTRLLATKLWVRLAETGRAQSKLSIKEQANLARKRMAKSKWGAKILKMEAEAKDGGPEALFAFVKLMNESMGLAIERARHPTDVAKQPRKAHKKR
jgi:hypothetical protein